jgi:DNA-binding NtrC family response regulator
LIIRPENLHLDRTDDKILTTSPQSFPESVSPPGNTLRDMEKTLIFDTLNRVNGNKMQASKILGISVRTIRNKLHEYDYETNDD